MAALVANGVVAIFGFSGAALVIFLVIMAIAAIFKGK